MTILVTGATHFDSCQIKGIEELGHQVIWQQNENEELSIAYDEVDGVICNGLFLYHDIDKFSNLKFVQLTSAGLDRVPLTYIEEKGIKLYNAKDVYSIPIAEYVLAETLSAYKKLNWFYENQKEHNWEKNRNLMELHGKTVCIVGCGSIGTECAKRFKAFGCKTVGIAQSIRDIEWFDEVRTTNEINMVFAESDVIVVALPLTDKTHHIINVDILKSIKEGTLLVNVSRGAVIDTAALVEVIKSKKIKAILDVFEKEPLEENSILWDMENVVITPHNSFVGDNNVKRLYDVVMRNIKD